MSTELQKQVNSQLRNNELAFLSQRALRVNGGSRKNKISFLFDAENAEFYARKGVTSQVRVPIFEDVGRLRLLGEQSLLELESLNPRITSEDFGMFFENVEVPSIQLLTREEAEERLEKLKRFVDFLVPYFLLDSAKICVEYLIQAYDMNVLLGEYLFYSFLPYHDMSEFCQLVRTLEIPEESEVRGLAESIKSTKTVISSRSHLSFILLRNPALFRSLVKFWEKRLRTFHLTKNVALTNLVTWLIIEMIEDLTRSKDLKNLEVFLEGIIEVVVFGACLKGSQYEGLRSTAYCILYKLSTPLLTLSNETQVRMIEEIFRSVSRDHQSKYSSYLPEAILLINHILTQLGTLSHFDCLVDHEITRFILENQNLFVSAFKQLSEWDSDFMQAFTLIIKSVFSFGASQDHKHSRSLVDFVGGIFSSFGDKSSLVSESQSKMVKAVVLVLIDLHPQSKFAEEVIQMIHSNYPSELISALSFSLSTSSSSDSQLFELRERAQSFVDIVLKGDEVERENSRMFLTLLNSQDLSVLNSCLDMITGLIYKSSRDLGEMTHLERRIFDLSLKHFIGSSFTTGGGSFSRDDFFNKFSLRILRLPQTVSVSEFLDLEDSPSRWRVPLIFRTILGYLRHCVTATYPSLSDFMFRETSRSLDLSCAGFGIEGVIMESIFPQDLASDGRLADLLKSLVFIIEERGGGQSSSGSGVEIGLDTIFAEYLDTFVPILALVAHQDLLFPQDLKEVSSRLLSLLNSKDRVQIYLKSVLEKPSLNYLEFSLILLKLRQLCLDLELGQVFPNHAFSEFGILFENFGQIISFLESLYYKFYYQISSVSKLSQNSGGNSRKTTTAGQTNGGVYALALLRSVFSLLLSKSNKVSSFRYRLLNIALIDTLDIGVLSNHYLVGLPIYQLVNLCFDSDHKTRNNCKVASLIVSLSMNLFNILSQGHSDSSPLFYGKSENVYTQALISHSYSFLEIIISKLPLSEDSFIASSLLEKILFSVLVYSIIPAFLIGESKSARLASFRLCKAVQDQLKQVISNKKASTSTLKFSDILSTIDDEDHDLLSSRVIGDYGKSLRSCYLSQLSPSISQVVDIIDEFLAHQSAESGQERNLLETIYRLDQSSDHKKTSGTVLILNFVMISEFILYHNRLEQCYYNLGFLSDYVMRNFNYGSDDGNYYRMLMQLMNKSDCFLPFTDQEKRRSGLDYESRVVIELSFLKQGVENLLNSLTSCSEIALEYIKGVEGLGESCRFFSDLSMARDIFCEALLMIIDERITRNIKDDNEFASFVAGVISKIAIYSPENIKKVSLTQYILKTRCLKRLDLLIICLLKCCCSGTKNIGLAEPIVLDWLCYGLNQVSLQLLDQDHNEEGLTFNKDLANQVLENLRMNNERLEFVGEEDALALFRMEICLIRILEFGVQFRRIVHFKQVKESVLEYFGVVSDGTQRRGKDEVISPRFLLDPMVVSSITSLLSNIRVENGSRLYLKVCRTLFSVYDYLVKNARVDDDNIEGRNYVIKSTFYSLSLYLDHSLSSCACVSQRSKERIRGILFNILVGEQIRLVVERRRFHSICDLLGFMEKLYNEVIYKDDKSRTFTKIRGVFMIIRHYLSGGVLLDDVDFGSLVDYMISNKLFDTRVQIYNELLVNILSEMETVVNLQDPTGADHFGTSKVVLRNLVLMTRSVVYFLCKTLLTFEIGSNEIRDLVNLFDHLVVIKTLMSRKIFKKLGAFLKTDDNDSCSSALGKEDDSDHELKSRIDQLEKEYVFVSLGLSLPRSGGRTEEDNNNNSLIYDNKMVQKDIDSLMQSIIADNNVKRHLVLNWDLSRRVKFEMTHALRKKFEGLLFDSKVDYLGIILKECLDQGVRVFLDGGNKLVLGKIKHILNSLIPDVGTEEKTIGVKETIPSLDKAGFELLGQDRKELRHRLRTWIKSWYVLDLLFRVVSSQPSSGDCGLEMNKMVFARIVEFYGRSKGVVVLKIPLIQNFLLDRISSIEEKMQGVSILYEVETILGDAIQTIRLLNESGSLGLEDKKVRSMLASMMALGHGKLKEEVFWQLPFMNLINAILGSRVFGGTLLVMSSDVKMDMLRSILLSERMVSCYDLFGLTSLLKSGRTGLKEGSYLGRRGGGEMIISSTLEECVARLVLTYSSLEGSLSSFSSSSSPHCGDDFIGMYSQILGEISSDLFSKLSKYENPSYYKRNKFRFVQEVNSCYSKLTSLVLVISFSIHFMDANKMLADKAPFIERFSQFYLLLINLLIINFSKLHLIRQAADGGERLALGRKRTGEEEETGEEEKSLNHFISDILGSDVLSSHVSVNPGWFGLDAKALVGLDLPEASGSLGVWRLESSISTMLSVFSLKLNGKRLREFILLIRRLIHRNEESFLSRMNEVTKKSTASAAVGGSSGEEGSNGRTERKSIREFYEEEISTVGDSDLAKDIYSCRIWVLVLLGVFESTGEYGIYCLIDDIALDIKSMSDLTQMNALTCVQNITISQYRNIKSPSKKRHSRSPCHQQITNLNHLDNEFGWYWYHLGVYNLMLIRMIYLHLSCSQKTAKNDDILPGSMQDYLVNPVITNLDMFALFELSSNQSLSGCGKQWDIILGDVWTNSIKCFRNNDLILAGMMKFLSNKLRNGNEQVRAFSAQVMLKLWKDEVCSVSILPYLSDILPTIKELLNDHSEEIISLTRLVIKMIEERTGESVFKRL